MKREQPQTLMEEIALIRKYGTKQKADFNVDMLWNTLSNMSPEMSMDKGRTTLRSSLRMYDAPSCTMYFVDQDASQYPVYTSYPEEKISSYEGVFEAFRNAGVDISDPEPQNSNPAKSYLF